MYANDFSVYRAVPIGVVIPRDADDVIAGVAACREYGAPVLPRGCGTAPSGQTTNVAVVFDYSKYFNNIVELDPDSKRARVQPGVICDQLRNAAEAHHLTYGPDPATHEYCTFGGMLGNNSCGTHSLMAGKTSDNVLELEVLLYDGTRLTVGPTTDEQLTQIIAVGDRKAQIYSALKDLRDRVADRVRAEFPDIPRRVSGYNLDQLLPENGFNVARALVGSEGTCANVLEATVRLVPSPQHRRTVILSYPDVFTAADHVPGDPGRQRPDRPRGLRRLPDPQHGRQGPPGGRARATARGPRVAVRRVRRRRRGPRHRARPDRHQGPGGRTAAARQSVIGKTEQVSVWKVRESAVGDSRLPGVMEAEGAWEDAAVHPDRLGAYLRDFQQLLDDHGYRCVYYGHFGQGCVHTRMDFDFKTAAGLRTFRSFMEKAADLVVAHGGSLAGEYGEGHGRAELLPRMFGPELMDAFHQFKRIWDPDWKMNPNRLIGDVKLDEGLRAGLDYRPPQLKTHFAYPDDGGSFANAIERCFGMAKCRNLGTSDDVPELPGHARGEALDSRPRPAAVRDVEGRPADRRLARRGRQGLARALPVVQGVHGRLPGPGRHPHLQGRVPRPLLLPARPAAAPLRARPDPVVGARSRPAPPGSPTRSRSRSSSPRPPRGSSVWPPNATPPGSPVRRSDRGFTNAEDHRTRGASVSSCGPTRSQTCSSPR